MTWLTGRAWPVVRKTWQGWQEDDGFVLSAAMAYCTAFSLLPLCLVLIAILGFVMQWSLQAEDAQRKLLDLVSQNAGPWLAGQLQLVLAGVKARANLGGPIGVVALLVAALGVFLQLDTTFDRIFRTPSPSRGWLGAIRAVLFGRLTAFFMLLCVGVLVVLIFLTNMVLAGIRPYVFQLPAGRSAWAWGQLGFTAVTNALLFGLIYRVLPRARIRWREALAGGALVSVIWIIGQKILASFLIGEGYTAYGIVGSFIAVMLWLYYASVTVILGAEFVQALAPEHPTPSQPPGA